MEQAALRAVAPPAVSGSSFLAYFSDIPECGRKTECRPAPLGPVMSSLACSGRMLFHVRYFSMLWRLPVLNCFPQKYPETFPHRIALRVHRVTFRLYNTMTTPSSWPLCSAVACTAVAKAPFRLAFSVPGCTGQVCNSGSRLSRALPRCPLEALRMQRKGLPRANPGFGSRLW